MKKILTIFLLCTICTVAWGSGSIQPRIIGGGDAPAGAYPWAVALLNPNIGQAFQAQNCGGSLIAPNVVLTAAHCVDLFDNAPGQLDVAVGINNLSDINQADRVMVNSIIIHPSYDPDTIDNDIALLVLARSVGSATLSLSTVALMDAIVFNSVSMTVIGWGALDSTATPLYPNRLQSVMVPYVDINTCNDALSGFVSDNMFCSGPVDGRKDSCQGDSGGPIFYTDINNNSFQMGIVSWGEGCAVAEKYGVYTKLVNYLAWIDDVMDRPHMVSKINMDYLNLNQSMGVTLYLTNPSNNVFSVTDITIESGASFITETSHNCDSLLAGRACEINLTTLAATTGALNGRIAITFNNGDINRVNITGHALGAIDANSPLGTNGWDWFSGGDVAWGEVAIGERSLYRSGAIADNQISLLQTSLNGPGVLRFDWRVSSELDYDFLDLYVDGALINGISGEDDWQSYSHDLADGYHRVSWRYSKDEDFLEGNDYGEIDNISFSLTSTGSSGSTGSGGGGSFNLSILWFLSVFLLLQRLNGRVQEWR